MDKTESTVRNMLTAIEAPLYHICVQSQRGMLPGLDGIPAAAVLDRLSLLKYRNVRGSHSHPTSGNLLRNSLLPHPLDSSFQGITHTSWTRRDGAPRSINALAQTKDGYLSTLPLRVLKRSRRA
jgi:hypothetical protein